MMYDFSDPFYSVLGRPPKHKTRSLAEAFPPKPSRSSRGAAAAANQNQESANGTPELGPTTTTTTSNTTDTTNNHAIKTSETTTSRKRSHAEFKEPDDYNRTGGGNIKDNNKNQNLILPQRRSSRQTTVHATQVSEGTLRPPGPPHLEAALNLALRNLESETWNYLWAFNEKHEGRKPLPTPSEMKMISKSVRRAAEAVDKADRVLEEAIDEIMLLNNNTRKKRRGPILSKYVVDRLFDTDSSASPTPRRTPNQD
ncbi:hypothetical protein Clacol_005903 [Clathrus columnatus]|uniref:Uncharacterized protein n=1 Tax=Clathrus columnatus TaxID=1419009 RepID=A0AAV5ADH6_9AGAM|nr:hypothetical protein Clacol_005903 [Clathrus columnatus]